MKEISILLVEDDFLNRRLTKKLLLENGYKILEAKNSREALSLLEKEKLDLAILDINLGKEERDGINLAEELKQKYMIPFIYLTAYDNTEIVTKAIATIPYCYITKPFKNTDLLTSIELAIHQSRQQEKHKFSVLVKDGGYNVYLPIENIDYIEAERNYLLFFSEKKVYRNRSTIKQILAILPTSIFIQTHRAFVVNKNKIAKFNIKGLVVNDEIIPISKNYIDDVNNVCRYG
ncbi:LytTR family DNA-binding domain-containing protein [Pedobacter sp. ASV28]|uniref:LytR/AlgR family response regulator transcription factor n=1 Tax=Pedobacter sp. ASV28 TaxID=2795123 RepID=UPI0018ED49D5|nr:response regulator transcription factor [Pedobacter sp. ASV28]